MAARAKSDRRELQALRKRMTRINGALTRRLNDFFRTSNRIGKVKDRMGLPHFDPVRESAMLAEIGKVNAGPMPPDIMKRVFREIFKSSIDQMGAATSQRLKVHRPPGGRDRTVTVRGVTIGGRRPVLIAGPCAVESRDQLDRTARGLRALGIRILRGGAFKPRTSPYSFQGLEEEALKMMREVADRLGMAVVTEVMCPKDVPLVVRYADILQVGARNMSNFALLREVGKIDRPVLLKRGFMATIDELMCAAEYIWVGGNPRIILCERGIRTFETQTRNTLDISAVPILKKETPLPVIVDVSHSLGRKDIVEPVALAALAAGADGLMFEAHCNPALALSDAEQQLDLRESRRLVRRLAGQHEFEHGR